MGKGDARHSPNKAVVGTAAHAQGGTPSSFAKCLVHFFVVWSSHDFDAPSGLATLIDTRESSGKNGSPSFQTDGLEEEKRDGC